MGSASAALSGRSVGHHHQIALRHRHVLAKAPSRGGMEMIWRVGQRLSRPATAGRQVPQVTSGLIVTRLPVQRPADDRPGPFVAEDQRRGRRSSWPR
jgi:hypothetical protein